MIKLFYAILFVKRHTNVQYKIEKLQREEIPDIPDVGTQGSYYKLEIIQFIIKYKILQLNEMVTSVTISYQNCIQVIVQYKILVINRNVNIHRSSISTFK